MEQVERHLKALYREQEQLLQWALKGFPEETVVSENRRINEKRNILQVRKAELEAQIKASQEAAISIPKLEHFVELVQEKPTTLYFDIKRHALDMLNLKVWVDGQSVEIAGTIPIEDTDVVTKSS